MAKQSYKLSIKGPDHSFGRDIDEAAANAILNYVMSGAALPAAGDASNAAGTAGASSSTVRGAAGSGAAQSVKQFIAAKKPGTEYERVACLAYYLANMRQQETFTNKDIVKLNTEAAQRPFGNSTQAINDTARKYHYLSGAGGKLRQITVLGEAVADALPDRERVKAALAELRPRKRKKRAKKLKAAS